MSINLTISGFLLITTCVTCQNFKICLNFFTYMYSPESLFRCFPANRILSLYPWLEKGDIAIANSFCVMFHFGLGFVYVCSSLVRFSLFGSPLKR